MAKNKEQTSIDINDPLLVHSKPCKDTHLPIIGKCSNKKVKEYYERQNNLLESYKIDSENIQDFQTKRNSLKPNKKKRNLKVIEKEDEVKIDNQ
uniref:Uncharacterized protein n=1 Tax=Acrobeloides nanus TaxID=290746 RepID=A0A914CTI7_9BILA